MKSKITSLDDALKRIDELEAEIVSLKERITELENRPTSGRKVHNEQWMANYDMFVELYEAGNSIPVIVESTPFSRRTVYRYKSYYDSIHKLQIDNEPKK